MGRRWAIGDDQIGYALEVAVADDGDPGLAQALLPTRDVSDHARAAGRSGEHEAGVRAPQAQLSTSSYRDS